MDSEQFNFKGSIEWLTTCVATFEKNQDIPIAELGKFLREFCKVFKLMGKLLSIAFSDVDEKVDIMNKLGELYKNECGGMLLATVKKEMALGITRLNSENNKKETKDPQYAKYNSLSRNLLRMMWFQNFLKTMFEELYNDREQKASKAFHKAYDLAFSKHHAFIVKTAASLAMSAAPSREKTLLLLMGGVKYPDEQSYQVIGQLCSLIDRVKTIQWNFYEANKLTELP